MSLSVELPDELIEELVARVLERLQEQPERKFLSKAALAIHLGVGERTIKSFRERGMPAHKVGRILMFDLAEVSRWLDREGQA